MAPADLVELRMMLMAALRHEGPSAIRYPRGKAFTGQTASHDIEIRPGKSEIILEGKDIAIIGIGNTVAASLKAAELLKSDGVEAYVVNARFIKPLDDELIISLCSRTKKIIIVEENVLAGGFGSAVLECLSDAGITDVAVMRIGIDDEFVEHGSQRRLREKYGLDEQGIYRAAREFIKAKR
jgi:1-deoxy-D-xylulose-5-phosphate synthase